MLRLIQTDLTATGKLDPGDRTPSNFLNIGTRHAFFVERGYLGLEIVAHEVEFVPGVLFVGMDRSFRWGQRKNHPSVASIYGLESEDILEEGAVSVRIFAEHDHMRTENHEPPPFLPRQYFHEIGGDSSHSHR
jgi:hypothetical protein